MGLEGYGERVAGIIGKIKRFEMKNSDLVFKMNRIHVKKFTRGIL